MKTNKRGSVASIFLLMLTSACATSDMATEFQSCETDQECGEDVCIEGVCTPSSSDVGRVVQDLGPGEVNIDVVDGVGGGGSGGHAIGVYEGGDSDPTLIDPTFDVGSSGQGGSSQGSDGQDGVSQATYS